MSLATEFPDFPAATLPPVIQGAGWSDRSWHNDAMPFVVHDASGVGIWLNYAGSDVPHDARFTAVALQWGDGDGWQHGIGGDLDLFSTDDVDVLVRSLPNFTNPRAIAHLFALAIEALPDIETIRARNATYEPGVCASHDYCDANMPMAEAFESVMGRAPDPANDDDASLWSQAWAIARAERLTLTLVEVR